MNERNENEPFWTAEETAAFLKLHPQTVYAKAKAGEIPSFKIGNARRFRPSEVRAWADAQRGQPAPSAAASAKDVA